MTRVVILVPRREGYADRDALWSFTRRWWEEQFPDWPVVEGHHDTGLFNRSAAVNRAAAAAGDWDVACLIDSDILTDPAKVRAAVPVAVETGQMVVPFEVRYNLNAQGTRRILDGDRGSWRPYVARTFRDQHSSVLLIPRPLYDDIGGFDEGFRGWGMEDTAWALACEVFAGRKLERLPGEVWHLHHASAPGEKHGSPSHRRNMARLQHYRDAHRLADREAIVRLVQEGRETPDAPHDGIPRILHRVVPERTPDVAEAWWQRWEQLHPAWRLITWRDPLDPAAFPLTSPFWGRCVAGAQLADLVRLEVLYHHGGVYVDMDMEPFRSLDPLLPAQVFAAWEDPKVIPNAVLGARPQHPLIGEAIDAAIKAMPKGVWAGGPGVTTRLFRDHPDVLLLPPASFYDVDYRDPDRDRKMTEPPGPWTFARHHYWGSWLPEERRKVPA